MQSVFRRGKKNEATLRCVERNKQCCIYTKNKKEKRENQREKEWTRERERIKIAGKRNYFLLCIWVSHARGRDPARWRRGRRSEEKQRVWGREGAAGFISLILIRSLSPASLPLPVGSSSLLMHPPSRAFFPHRRWAPRARIYRSISVALQHALLIKKMVYPRVGKCRPPEGAKQLVEVPTA